MTQADLAQQLNVTPKAVSRWERGIGFPDINTLAPLAEALDVSLQELMRSERADPSQTAAPLSQEAAAKMMSDAVEMAREGGRRERASTRIGIAVLLATALLAYHTGHINVGGALFIGFTAALAAAGGYLLTCGGRDRDWRVYAFFLWFGTGLALQLLHSIGMDGWDLAYGLYLLFILITGRLCR